MQTYEIIKTCWINKVFYKEGQLVKLLDSDAQEWLDRACIKIIKSKNRVLK